MKWQLLFILSDAKLFTQFYFIFSKEDPLIHNEIKCLIKIARCICKEHTIKLFKSDLSNDPFENENLISPKDEKLQKGIVHLSEKNKS